MNNFLAAINLLLIESGVALAGALAVLVGFGAAIAMGIAISKAMEGISRQPEAEGKIRSTLLIGLAFIETTAIYGLFVSILILLVV